MKLLKKLTKIFLIIFIATCLFVQPNDIKTEAADYTQNVQEFRAVWVSHFAGDLSRYQNEEQYKKQYLEILDNMEEMGFNAIIFHIRTHNDAFYPSKLNPVSSYYSEVNFDEFDPLAWMIEETHSRGIEFHAWLNPYRVSSTGVSDIDALTAKYDEVNPASNKENLLITSGGVILNPGLPHVRQFITDTCMEIVENYDVDAIHFDDYFYISDCDDTATREKYNTENLSLGNFRRKQVDLFIEQLSNELKAFNLENDRTVQLGISPSGIYRNGSSYNRNDVTYNADGDLTYPLSSNTSGFAHYDNYLYSDTKKWIDEEWIDYILPQSYWAIGHNGANFNRLTDWWSLVVEHKDVNLYMGIGIYMATGSGGSASYWKSPDEVENQLLDMNKYDKISGMSFYKYSTLLSSNSLIKGHVETLKEYWTKKIPCAVIPGYTHLPEPVVSNVSVENNILTFDPVDNVRGYMIWQVPSNEFVDITSYDQLYTYTTATEIEVVEGYDYYVSTVNLANEISEAVSGDIDTNYEDVIGLINNISFPITQSDINKINNLKARYDSLSTTDQALVTNYYILEAALAQANVISNINVDINEFISSLKTDTINTYKLLLIYKDYEITWEYQNPDDANIYDFTTGRILKHNLATTNIDFTVTFTKDNVSVSSPYTLNVGYVKRSETGLFYRNTPNSLNKEEDTDANAGYIGWSGVVMKFDDKVFFVAEGNYIKLTSSLIPSTKWHSCANVFVNKTNSNITASLTDFDILTTANYGYFIIDENGLVRETVTTATSNVTLKPNETIFIPKYLDSQIEGSYMKPASNLPVGTKVEIITPVYEDNLIQEIIDQINDLPTVVTLNHENAINALIDLINTLTDEEKTQVSNLNTLLNKKAELDELLNNQEGIDAEVQVAIEQVTNHITDKTLYSASAASEIDSIIAEFMAIISVCNKEQIAGFVAQYIELLDSIKTLEEEAAEVLQQQIDSAKAKLASYIKDLTLYYDDQIEEINSIIADYSSKLDNATTSTEVNNLLLKGQSDLRNVPVKIVVERRLAVSAINNTIKEIDMTNYSDGNKEQVNSLGAIARSKVNNAVTIDAIRDIIAEFQKGLSDVAKEHLNEYKGDKILEAKAYIANLELGNNSLETLVTEFENNMNSASTIEEVDELLAQFKVDVDELMNPETPDNDNTGGGFSCNFGYFSVLSLLLSAGLILILKKKN